MSSFYAQETVQAINLDSLIGKAIVGPKNEWEIVDYSTDGEAVEVHTDELIFLTDALRHEDRMESLGYVQGDDRITCYKHKCWSTDEHEETEH